MEAISQDLRDRVIAAVDEGTQSRGRIAERFKVSYSWVGKLLRRRRETGSAAAKPHTGNKPAVLSGERLSVVREAVDERPDATLAELRDRVNRRLAADGLGVTVSRSGVARAVAKVDRPLKKRRCTPARGTRRG